MPLPVKDGLGGRAFWRAHFIVWRWPESTASLINSYKISGIRGYRMPWRRVSWLSTLPWVKGGDKAYLGLWNVFS